MSERYCTQQCAGPADCKHRNGGECIYEYVAANYQPEYRWQGEGNPPRRWTASNGTVVYRTLADYYDD